MHRCCPETCNVTEAEPFTEDACVASVMCLQGECKGKCVYPFEALVDDCFMGNPMNNRFKVLNFLVTLSKVCV